MKRVATALAVSALFGALAFADTYSISLRGDREVGNAGDPDGWGHAVVIIDGAVAHFFIWVKGIAAPTAAHIHAARAGVNGPVSVGFPAGSFAEMGGGAYQAMGSVAVDAAVSASIAADPTAFYVNVHTAEFPGGAVRGQLLGEGAAAAALATDLRGAREVPSPGDAGGAGHATVIRDAGSLVYYLWVKDIEAPTAAHIHTGAAGKAGGVAVGFSGLAFANGQAAGTVSADASILDAIWQDPDGFYVNVHNAEFPGGAVRGQLGASETTLYVPVVARNPGQGSSVFVTDVRVLNLADTDAEVFVSWFPKGAAGAAGPAAVTRLAVVSAGEAVVNDVVGTLFGANDRGALVLSSTAAVRAAARTFNDQRGAGSGTFGQFVEAVSREHAHHSGALLLGSHRPKADGRDFRLNAGYFNPNPFPVEVTFNVRRPDGTAVAAPGVRTLAPWANDLAAYHALVPGIPAAAQSQPAFFVTYSAPAPVFIYSSLVDNLTDDGLHEPAQPIPDALVARRNRPPNGVITSPAGNETIAAGQAVTFAGSASDPDGDEVSVLWDFGDGVSSTQLEPGAHTFVTAGTFTVTFTATDAKGLADPTPDTRVITVNPAATATLSRVQGEIFDLFCVGCHPPSGGLDLDRGNSHGNLVNVPSTQQPGLVRVRPGDPDASYLYRKINGGPGITGSRMPQGGPFLSTERTQLLRDWILAGAPDN